ncbi:MAG: TcpQ domain-containing protein [Rhodospirillales bacterium]|nr:TcpQ domain-containing protein [Rhodospirillales bacterium]MCB9973663.1 TcpQ domain-containing protein [Rhodospirillales bacterium]
MWNDGNIVSMRVLRLFLAFIGLWFSAGMAAAQETSSPLMPVHGWLMGSAALDQGEEGACLLFNQFSDGSALRLNIQGDDVRLLTIIYRNDLFDPSVSYTYQTSIETSSSFRELLDGYAYSSNTLSVTPVKGQAFFEALKHASKLVVSVSGETRTFNLKSLSAKIMQAKECGDEGKTAPVLQRGDAKEVHIYADLTLPKRKSLTPDVIWRANRGERMSQVLKRWSEKSGKEIEWRPSSDPLISSDFVFQGSQDQAMEKLFAQEGR